MAVTNVSYDNISSDAVVTLEMAKHQLKLEADFDLDNVLITHYIAAAVGYCEQFIGGYILKRDMIMKLDAFENPFAFEFFPLVSVTDISYFDEANEEQTIATNAYSLTSLNSKVFKLVFKNELPKVYDRFDAVTITASVGYENAAIPKQIQQVVLLKLTDMYEKREDRGEVVSSVGDGILKQFKKY